MEGPLSFSDALLSIFDSGSASAAMKPKSEMKHSWQLQRRVLAKGPYFLAPKKKADILAFVSVGMIAT